MRPVENTCLSANEEHLFSTLLSTVENTRLSTAMSTMENDEKKMQVDWVAPISLQRKA
jgi:hypothetical protein